MLKPVIELPPETDTFFYESESRNCVFTLSITHKHLRSVVTSKVKHENIPHLSSVLCSIIEIYKTKFLFNLTSLLLGHKSNLISSGLIIHIKT